MIDEITFDACIRKLIALGVPKVTLLQADKVQPRPLHAPPAKAFVALVLLAYWLDPKPPFCNEAFDVIELFAGRARITRLAQAAGYQAVAADQKYDLHETSSLHMNESSGFVFPSYTLCSASGATHAVYVYMYT